MEADRCISIGLSCSNLLIEYFKHVAVGPEDTPKRVTLRVTVQTNDAGVRRQVDAVNKLCSGTNKWQRVFLNHSSSLPVVNPIESLQLPNEKIDEAMMKVLQSNNVRLNPERVHCVESCTNMPGGVLVIQGFPDCGKSWTIAAMAKVFLLLGVHVILAAPTHAAVDALCNRFCKFEETLNDSNEAPVRAYGDLTEM